MNNTIFLLPYKLHMKTSILCYLPRQSLADKDCIIVCREHEQVVGALMFSQNIASPLNLDRGRHLGPMMMGGRGRDHSHMISTKNLGLRRRITLPFIPMLTSYMNLLPWRRPCSLRTSRPSCGTCGRPRRRSPRWSRRTTSTARRTV